MSETRDVREKVKGVFRYYWEKVTWLEGFLIIISATIFMGVLIYKLGTLTSGYHFLDDHELIRIQTAIEKNGQSVGRVLKEWIQNDLIWRFRPVYWCERVFVTSIFGTNLLYWNIYTAIKGIVTFCLLYFTARFLKCNPIISGLFTVLILYGEQFTPWFRSANQENTGLMLSALAMCLIAAQANFRKSKSVAYNLLIVVLTILCGLVKESFTLIMPAIMGFKFLIEYHEKSDTYYDVFSKRNIVIHGSVLIAFLANIYMIVYRVGLDQVSYAGFHQEVRLKEYLRGIVHSYWQYTRWYVNAGIILLILLILKAGRQNWKKYFSFILLSSFVLLIQMIAHAKSGMWERYLIPWIVGYAALFVIVGYKMLQHTKVLKWGYLIVLCLLVYLEAPLALSKARDYAYDGHMTAVYFQNILDNTESDSYIVSTFFDEELNLSTECWLQNRDRPHVYSVNQITGKLEDKIQLSINASYIPEMQDVRIITCYETQVDEVLEMLELNESQQYNVNVNGKYAVICVEKYPMR